MSRNFNSYAASVYSRYVTGNACNERDIQVNDAKSDLLSSMLDSPDYQPNAQRNGRRQGMLLTRGGEKHTYNVVCRPGDELYAGDMIDVFGEKWIVMEARSDDTTHRTGIIQQCNYCFRFQNGTPEVYERWGYLDISGYSAAFNNNVQLQISEEQVAIYIPYDNATKKLFVDKRLPSHIGYDSDGNRIMFTFKITGVNPVSESYNNGDHLIMLKAVRGLYSKDRDDLNRMICDYIDPDSYQDTNPPHENDEDIGIPSRGFSCRIDGSQKIRIGTSRTYHAEFYNSDFLAELDSTEARWEVSIDGSGESQIINESPLVISIEDDPSKIGEIINITLFDADEVYFPAVMKVEVVGIG